MRHSINISTSSKSHARALIVLGIPIIIGQLGTIAQSFADTIMVGRYGTSELAASGFVNNVFNLVIFFLLGFSYSTTPIVGANFGRKQYDDCSRTLKESLFANLLTCFAAMLFMLLIFFNLHHLGQPENLLPLIRPYFLIILSSLPFMSAFNSLKQFSDGVGDTKTPMYIMIIGNMANIIGNYLLIYGFSVPFAGIHVGAMGLNGAGIATLASRVLMAIVLWIIVRKSTRYSLFHPGFKKKMTKRGVIHLSKLGLPISLQLSLESASFNLTAVMMGWLGEQELASHQVICTIGTLCFMFYYGVGAAAAVRISHFRGRGELGEIRRIAFTAYALAIAAGLILTPLIAFNFNALCFAFTSSQDVVMICMTLLLPFCIYQLGDCTQILFANSLRAIEDVKPLMWYAFIAYIIVSVPSSYLFGFTLGLGALGIWFGFPLGLSTAGILFLTRFLRKTRGYVKAA